MSVVFHQPSNTNHFVTSYSVGILIGFDDEFLSGPAVPAARVEASSGDGFVVSYLPILKDDILNDYKSFKRNSTDHIYVCSSRIIFTMSYIQFNEPFRRPSFLAEV